MPEYKEVIKGLMDTRLPYLSYSKAYVAITNAIELIKKQEPKKPCRDTVGEYVCPNEGCHHRLSLMLKQKYCDVCGQAVKWE